MDKCLEYYLLKETDFDDSGQESDSQKSIEPEDAAFDNSLGDV